MKATTLTKRSDAAMQRIAVLVLVVVGGAAALLSWTNLNALATSAGVAPGHGWLFALSVDGLVLAGTVAVLHAAMAGARVVMPWSLVLLGSALSLWGNVAASSGSLVSVIVHAAPSLVLLATLEALMAMKRSGWRRAVAEAQAVEEEDAAAQRRQERAEKRAQAAETRAARAATAEGLTARAAIYREALVGQTGASLTEQAVAVLTLHDARYGGRVPAHDVALALGTDIIRARKAVERGRAKMREGAEPQRRLAAVVTA